MLRKKIRPDDHYYDHYYVFVYLLCHFALKNCTNLSFTISGFVLTMLRRIYFKTKICFKKKTDEMKHYSDNCYIFVNLLCHFALENCLNLSISISGFVWMLFVWLYFKTKLCFKKKTDQMITIMTIITYLFNYYVISH